jgi:hypothetical protein
VSSRKEEEGQEKKKRKLKREKRITRLVGVREEAPSLQRMKQAEENPFQET